MQNTVDTKYSRTAGSNTDGSSTTGVSNSFLSPFEKIA